jgi:3-oxoacyl-[acyl-carrier protein] reductase
MTPTKPWEACRAWVTGGSSGIGLGFALELASLGCEVHITSREPESEACQAALARVQRAADAWAKERGRTAREARAHRLDLADLASVQALAKAMRGAVPDLLVHSAHVFAPHSPIVALAPETLATSLSTNVAGAYGVLRGAARLMGRAGFGRVLILGSLASQLGGVGQVAYITEKAALEGLGRAFSSEFAARGVLFNIVHPGIVDTANVRARVDARVLRAFARRTASGRLLQVEEVVLASLPLLDPRQCITTGQALRLSGGVDAIPALLQNHREHEGGSEQGAENEVEDDAGSDS